MNSRQTNITSVSSDTLDRLMKDDLEAFELVYDFYFNRVFNFLKKYTLTLQDAEEITQDVFLKVWNNRKTIDISRSFNSLIYTI